MDKIDKHYTFSAYYNKRHHNYGRVRVESETFHMNGEEGTKNIVQPDSD